MTKCVNEKDGNCVATVAQNIWKMVPEESRLYYIGVVTGEGTGLAIGHTQRWIPDRQHSLRIDPFENGPDGALEVDREVKGLTVLYTGTMETVKTVALNSYYYPRAPRGSSVAYGFEDSVTLSTAQRIGGGAYIFLGHGARIKEHAKDRMVLVDSKYWDFAESGDVNLLTGVISEKTVQGETKKVFRTAQGAILTKKESGQGDTKPSTKGTCAICMV